MNNWLKIVSFFTDNNYLFKGEPLSKSRLEKYLSLLNELNSFPSSPWLFREVREESLILLQDFGITCEKVFGEARTFLHKGFDQDTANTLLILYRDYNNPIYPSIYDNSLTIYLSYNEKVEQFFLAERRGQFFDPYGSQYDLARLELHLANDFYPKGRTIKYG